MKTKSKKPFNQLTEAESERLALLIEECAEVQQIACKILRHGYESFHPTDRKRITNRDLLAVELGDLQMVTELITDDDIDINEVQKAALCKRENARRWLHHQEYAKQDTHWDEESRK